jgi:hypothetical protein
MSLEPAPEFPYLRKRVSIEGAGLLDIPHDHSDIGHVTGLMIS